MTIEQLCSIVPTLKKNRASTIIDAINNAMEEGEINTPLRQAAFIAQIAHETGGFKWFRELGSAAYFKRYEHRTDLGNVKPADVSRFKGRGFIQMTGRSNYAAAGNFLGLDLVNNPELAETPEVGARIDIWYWTTKHLNSFADKEDFKTITKKINGGLNGYDDRLEYYNRAKKILS